MLDPTSPLGPLKHASNFIGEFSAKPFKSERQIQFRLTQAVLINPSSKSWIRLRESYCMWTWASSFKLWGLRECLWPDKIWLGKNSLPPIFLRHSLRLRWSHTIHGGFGGWVSFIAVCNNVGEPAFLGPNQNFENRLPQAS